MAPAIKSAKRNRQTNKTQAGGGKKAAAVAKEEEGESDGDDLDEPTPKRGKVVTKREAQDDSF